MIREYKYKIRVQKKEELEPEEILFDSDEKKKEEKGRLEVPIRDTIFLIVLTFIFLIFISLFTRSLFLIEVRGEELRAKASENYLKNIYIEAPRGLILSEDGVLLTKNIKNDSKEKPFDRYYPNSFYFSSIIGYSRQATKEEIESDPSYYRLGDWIGKDGLEKEYEIHLRGEKGIREKIINAKGEVLSDQITKEPVQGNSLVLNINAALQKKVFDALKKGAGNKNAAAIALNPQNGKVLALVSLPSDNNNIFSGKLSAEELEELESNKKINNPNWVLSGLYPPGSIIKPLIAAAALEENIVNPSTSIDCRGRVVIPNPWDSSNPSVKKDWKTHGVTNLKKAIAQSCNIYFFTVGGGYDDIKGLGISLIKKYLDLFYIEKEVGIDLPGENVGFVPSADWFKKEREELEKRNWSIADIYDVSIGQGYFSTTPLHMAVALSSIANGGKIYQPQIVDRIEDVSKRTILDITPKVLKEDFIKKENIDAVRKGMRECVLTGSCRQLLSLPVSSGGKTGTAEAPGDKEPYAWFVSFAPYEKPEIILLVMIEYGGGGEKVAEPIAEEVLQWYFESNKPK
ncbi:MAG: penicillin-binding transpeptidase domain-containing protein [Patescibacteria group bacterium]